MVKALRLHGQPVEQGLIAGVACPAYRADAHSRGLRALAQGRFLRGRPTSTGLFRAASLPNRLVQQDTGGNADVETFDFAKHGNTHQFVAQAAGESAQA